jgi:hypothetical protein
LSFRRFKMDALLAKKFIVLITGLKGQVAFGHFNSMDGARKNLEGLGFNMINDAWGRKLNVDAYIRQLYPPDKMAEY